MTETKTKPQFARLTDEQRTYMERAQIGDMFVTSEQVDEIAETFDLDGKSRDELRAIRNSAVRYLSDLTSIARMLENVKEYDRYHNALSGITTVIDHAIYCASY